MTTTELNMEVTPASRSLRSAQPGVDQPTIAFYGVFGVENLGNECTLQSILLNAREWLPHAQFYSICYEPEDTARRHEIAAIPISARYLKSHASGKVVHRRSGLRRLLRVLFQRLPCELMDWVRAVKSLRRTNLVIMTGTGMLTDYSTSTFGYPYDIFKWTVAARLAGSKVRFVGIGVGSIYSRLSRVFIRAALSLADYRSYRDEFSKNRIKVSGFDSSRDSVFPDLVFSLPKGLLPQRPRRIKSKRIVGLGVMDHRDIHMSAEAQQAGYASYLETICNFISWLLKKGYGIRIIQGDVKYDTITRAELRIKLASRGIDYAQFGIVDEGAATVEELMAQIAETEFVVSPRYHNLLSGLMVGIPCVSISYDPKNDALLDGMGLSKYHQPLTELNLQKLIEQFTDLELRADELKPIINRKASGYRTMLDQQYQLIFDNL